MSTVDAPAEPEAPSPRSSSDIRWKPLVLLTALWAVLLLAAVGIARAGSYQAEEAIHAVELGDATFIHGSKLDCVVADVIQRANCRVEIDNRMLNVDTNYGRGAPDGSGIESCAASLDGREINCEPHWVTSSYWPYGVQINDAELLELAGQDGSVLGGWRTAFLGRSEGAVLSAVLASTAAIVLAVLLLGLTTIRSTWQRSGRGVLWAMLPTIPIAVITAGTLLAVVVTYGYVD